MRPQISDTPIPILPSDAIESIQKTGGKNTAALLWLYFDKLSLVGADKFLETVGADHDLLRH